MNIIFNNIELAINNEKKEWKQPTLELISKDLIANQLGVGGDGGVKSSNAS